ncbi:hypothetical protein [Sedimenticola selenatireducens]|uniref:Uncharacterized protein n=1 Tax=Sedimenticola selenatireducens TaxID=191960 RepID=A0A557RY01_9GAMM|nr:hypothetical protein [Sedimenticola selenatireducens]TVO70021.1 hypothetical protein FHP88_17010 [Sedimenticola selenatireducens]TVT61737.1 MAG: hypothetical protein FHK78_16875 [Sedimenticola selenatireducens]
MSCSTCGYEGAHSRHSCPVCNAGGGGLSLEDAEKMKKVGAELGGGIRKAATSRFLSFLWFYITWVIVSVIVGMKTGLLTDDAKNDPFWYKLFVLILPIVLMVVFRRQIRKYIPIVFGSLLTMLGYAFFLFISVLAVMWLWSLMKWVGGG